jgi:perosamine synthetase
MEIPFLKPDIRQSDINRMVKSLKTSWLVPGQESKTVENKLKSYLKVKHAKLTSSCTTALHAALIMCGVKEGDEVITTPVSWVATSNVILYLKAKPVFVDIDETGCLNPDLIEAKITPKTKAIIVVHYCGQLADMKKINKIAKKHGLKVIEDAAHCLLKGIGTGDYACLSFHAAKNITSGQGGAIISNSPIDNRIIYHGVEKIDGKRVMTGFGFKGEMTDFQAALLIGQINRLEQTLAKRKKVFENYTRELFYTELDFPEQKRPSAYHMFIVWSDAGKRDLIRKKLLAKGIETSIHYSPIHLEPYYQQLGFKKGSFPIAEKTGEEVITLPTYALTKKQQDYVIRSLKEVL